MRIMKKLRQSVNNAYVNLDRSTGRTFFGNHAGLKHNVTGTIRKKKYSLSYDSTQNLKENSEFESNGYIYLGKADLSLIEVINSKFQEMIEDDRYSEVGPEYKGTVYMRKLRNPIRDIPEIRKLFTKDFVKKLEDCHNGHFQIKGVEMWRTNHIPPEIERESGDLFSNLWHCDYSNVDETKLFFYLVDITEKEGPIHMMPPNITKELIKKGYVDRYQIDLNNKLFESQGQIFKGIGSAGTALLINTEVCLHKAGNPTQNHHRDVMQFHFKSSSEPLSNDWINNTN